MHSTNKGELMAAPANSIATRIPTTTRQGSVSARRGRSTTRVDQPARPADERALPQLRLGGIIAIWAAAALPMGLLAWVVSPLLADQLSGPSPLIRTLIVTLTGGLVWQFVLTMILVAREQGSLRWSVLRDALWLRAPRAPRTGRRGGRLWLVVLPLMVAFAAEGLVPGPGIPAGRDMFDFLGSDAGHTLLAGAWGWFAIIAALAVFNTVLGEELLFRGYLLPRMNGVFGRRDWLANGVLFAAYHLHMPWAIPSTLLDTFILAYPSRRYRSALIGIAVHSAQSVVLLGLVLSLVLKG
jgi:membrane protease YdiL (CAAX protease family)